MRDQANPDRDLPPQTAILVIPPGSSTVPPAHVPPETADVSGAAPCSRPDCPDAAQLLQSIPDGVLIVNAEGRIIALNSRAEEITRYSAAELAQIHAHRLISGADTSLMSKLAELLRRSKRICIEAQVVRKNGAVFAADIHVTHCLRGNNAVCYCFFLRDATRRKQSEDALKSANANISQARRVQTAATIAGQIAHDFDNLLTPLFVYPELIRAELPETGRGRELLAIIENTAKDMAQITQQLLSLSRRGQQKQVAFKVNEIVQRVATIFHDDSSYQNVEFTTDLAEDILPLRGAPEQMLRVIQNICQNAADAIEHSGKVRITTRNVYLDRPIGHHDKIDVGEYILITIADNGSGIPDDIKNRIFDPFFTTKKTLKRRGAGLGLSVVQGIVADHRGFLDFDSTPGKGTTFRLYFPICREEPPVKEHKAGMPAHGGSVLVVDDDAQQRQVIADLFSFHDFRVSVLPNGESAVDYIAERASPSPEKTDGKSGGMPDLIVLDVIMDPGMDGREACKRILEINPHQRMLLVSGYPNPEDVGLSGMVGNVSYLGKPLTWEGIRQAMDRSGPGREGVAAPDKEAPCVPNRILVVDDEGGIRRLFTMILSSGFPRAKIDTAANGLLALESFKTGHHSVVLLDLRMPVMDGEAAFHEIHSFCRRNNWETPSVVFCTGFAPPGIVKRIATDGQKHCLLAKPVSGNDLVTAVKERLRDR